MENIIKLPEVMRVTTLSRSSIYAMVKEKTFPKPILLGRRSVGWVEGEVLNWILAKKENRKGAAVSNSI